AMAPAPNSGNQGLRPTDDFADQQSVRNSLRDGTAIMVEVNVPVPRDLEATRFLRAVGENVNFTVTNYDTRTGDGSVATTSFGDPGGRITATENILNIAFA